MESDLGPVIGSVEPQPMVWREMPDVLMETKSRVLGYAAVAAWVLVTMAWAWFVFTATPVHAAIPCDIVIERAKGLTIEQAEKRAKAMGLTEKQIAEVKACLKGARK